MGCLTLSVGACGGSTTEAPPAVAVSVAPAIVSLGIGAVRQLTATVTGTTNAAVTWTSSDDAIVTVSTGGVVTGIAAGTATVTATSVADSSRSASSNVTVKDWSLAWSDEFDGPAAAGVDPTKWLYDLGIGYPGGARNWGTGEIETMTSDTANVSLDGQGHLRITPLRDSVGKWTSGRIETLRNDFQPATGSALAVEASIQQPNVTPTNGLGYWPAFWMLGGTFRGNYTNWPTTGEIDVLENVNGHSSVFATFHCGPSIPGTCNEPSGIGSGERSCTGCLTGFHTYRVEWDKGVSPGQLRWYVDGVKYFEVSQTQVGVGSWLAATDHGYMIILDVAVGGGFPDAFGGGPTAATISGVPMAVDYVRVFTR